MWILGENTGSKQCELWTVHKKVFNIFLPLAVQAQAGIATSLYQSTDERLTLTSPAELCVCGVLPNLVKEV